MNVKLVFVSIMVIIGGFNVLADENDSSNPVRSLDWTLPYSIDPMDHSIGDFIDTELPELLQKAETAYGAKNYTDAARYYLMYLRHDIRNLAAIYNLACCYALLGDDVLAAKYLKRAGKAGFSDIELLGRDPDFDLVREKPAVAEAIAEINKEARLRDDRDGSFRWFKASTLLPGNLHLPANFDKSKKYPLVIGLHGYGSDARNFNGLWTRFESPEFIYVSLRAPYSLPTTTPGFSWSPVDIPDGSMTESEIATLKDTSDKLVSAFILDTISRIRSEYPVSSVYLLGFSQGAMQSFATGLKHPGKINGIISIGGRLVDGSVSDSELKAAKKVRILIAHGKDDRSVSLEDGQSTRDVLIKNGNPVEFVEYEGGHIVSETALKSVTSFLKTPK